MRVLIDMQAIQTPGSRTRGIGRYCLDFVKHFISARGNNEVFLLLNDSLPYTINELKNEFRNFLPSSALLVFSSLKSVGALDSRNTLRRNIAENLRESYISSLNVDWVIMTSLFEGYNDDAVTSVNRKQHIRTAVILYDLIPYIYQDIYLNDQNVRDWYINKIDNIRRADLLLAISNSSAKEAADYLGFCKDKIVGISTAANEFFTKTVISKSQSTHLKKKYSINKKFVMYTGGVDFRKNIERLIEAWSLLDQTLLNDYQLAIVCKADNDYKNKLLCLSYRLGLVEGSIIFTGFVSDNDLLSLYNTCDLFIFPSWHEGFGLPALEAMHCGKPVIGANASSLPEVIGREDALFNPYDPKEISNKLARALVDNKWKDELSNHSTKQAKKFSWSKSAQVAWQSLINFKDEPNNISIRRFRKKLAYISPIPPEKSGIAAYSAELIKDLSKWYDIYLVTKHVEDCSDRYLSAVCNIISVESFVSQNLEFDRVLYHIGNSEFHDHMFDLIEKIPGCTVLHDFFLSGVQSYSQWKNTRTNAFFKSLYRSHGYKAIFEISKNDKLEDLIYKYPVNIEILQNSLGVIVHSEFNLRLAETWYGLGASAKFNVIPHMRAPRKLLRREAREKLSICNDKFIISTFGIIAKNKLNSLIFSAFKKSKLSNISSVSLVFVGDGSNNYGTELQRSINAFNCAASISITGWVDDDEYHEWLKSSDLAIQLRSLSRGETSGTILDCFSYGIPTIINSHGTLQDISDKLVYKLDDNFTESDLINALETLYDNENFRKKIGQAGLQSLLDKHRPRDCSRMYFESIEKFYEEHNRGIGSAYDYIKGTRGIMADLEVYDVSCTIAKNYPRFPRQAQIFVNITQFISYLDPSALTELKKAVENWLNIVPVGTRIEPVYTNGLLQFYYARNFMGKLFDTINISLPDEPIDVFTTDIFINYGTEVDSSMIDSIQCSVVNSCRTFDSDIEIEHSIKSNHFNYECNNDQSIDVLVKAICKDLDRIKIV